MIKILNEKMLWFEVLKIWVLKFICILFFEICYLRKI